MSDSICNDISERNTIDASSDKHSDESLQSANDENYNAAMQEKANIIQEVQ